MSTPRTDGRGDAVPRGPRLPHAFEAARYDGPVLIGGGERYDQATLSTQPFNLADLPPKHRQEKAERVEDMPSVERDMRERAAAPADDCPPISPAEAKALRVQVFEVVQEQARLRTALGTAAARMANAASFITPGMKAGTAEAKALLILGRAEITTTLGDTDA